MSLLTAQDVTNLYLYGSKTKPADLADNGLIRSLGIETTKIPVDVNDYMQNGPGRFASPAFFEIVKLFFSPATSGLAPGVYTEQELRLLVETSQAVITQQQWAYDDGKGDYADRVYIWNSVAFEIADQAQFVVEANGDRYIENFAIEPFVVETKPENFDFSSDDWIAILGNNLLEERVDPSGIGRKVEFEFSTDGIVTRYDFSSYQNDVALAVLANPLLLVGLYNKMTDLTDQLFKGGTIKFLSEGKPILYGTTDNDSINGAITTTGVDFVSQRYLKDYVTGGIYYITGDGDDSITATAKSDILSSGLGDDNLDGKGGDDTLEGGIGADTYAVNAGDGIDTVLDADGSGTIKFGMLAVTGSSGVDGKNWVKLGSSWVDLQNGIGYVLEAQSDGTNDLLVRSNDGNGVRIKDWSEGKLGIAVGGNTLPVAPTYDLTIKGDLKPAYPLRADSLGNTVVTTEESPNREDVLLGSTDNDLIQGLGGNDQISGKEGDDRLEGGSGQDALSGAAGQDVVLGGADSDIVLGHENNDRLYANTEYTIDEAYSLGETQAGSGQRGDFLDGAYASDILIGEAGDDILMGGADKDILMGLGGNDTIEGDIDAGLIDHNWSVSRTTKVENGIIYYGRSYSFEIAKSTGITDLNGAGGNDVVFGGAGDDWIYVQGGDDFVDAGADNDVVFGGAGNDLILGQGGNDNLIGDSKGLDASLHGGDYLDGGDGNDRIFGNSGSDHLLGGAGDDELYADEGSDVLNGGSGNDSLYGGSGEDTYRDVEGGDFIGDIGGKNIIILANSGGISTSSTNEPQDLSVIAMAEPTLTPANAPSGVSWLSDTAVLRMTLGNGESIDLFGALYGMSAQIYFDQGNQSIDLEAWVSEHLSDAVTLDLSALSMDGQTATVGYSGTGADVLMGSDNNDTLRSYGGNDELQGNAGDDLLEGGSGDDILFGQDGADTLQGGDGYDSLQGGIGDDSLDGGADDDVLIGEEGADTLYGSVGTDILSGMDGTDVLYGGDGGDELQGGLDNDVLEGDAGDDNLFGQEGSDELHGGAGNDVLSGNAGDDVYLFNLGGGWDTIWEEGDSAGDVLRFGAGIAPEDISAAKSGYDLVLFHANGVDQVTISNWYADPSWRLMQFEFSDGTTWIADDIGNQGLTSIRGTPGSDMLYGGALDETLSGFSGNDTLYGNAGNDTLIGGVGNDALYGGAGANIYLFALGDGNDTIAPNSSYADTLYFSADIASTDIIVERMGNDLLLHHQNGLDSVKIAGWYSSYSQLKEVVFESDGAILANSALNQLGVTHGNTYTLDLGDGAKNIADWGGSDSLTFGANIAEAEIVIVRVGQDLKFTHVNGIDSIAIKDWFNNVSNQIETIRFSTTVAVLTAAQHTTPFLTLTGTAGNDIIQGGNAYGETLAGLGGNDTLNGGDEQDTYLFNQGDGQDTVTDTSLGGNALIFGPGLLNQLSISVNASNDAVYSFGADKVTVKAGSPLQIKFVSNGTAAADLLNGGSYGDIIHGLASNDVIDGSAGGDDLYGDTGNDTIAGGDDSDWLYGGDGDDVLDGSKLTGIDEIETNFSDSIDYYVGGKGNDTLYGNSKDDYYYFDLGDGRDVIVEGAYYLSGYWYYGVDTLIFGAGITPDNIQVNKLNADLVVTTSLTDSVTIKDWFTASGFKDRVEFFRFADGSNLSATDMTRLANTLRGTEGDDVLTIGSSSDGVLYGEGGNDTLNGGGGNDALHGGSGNDLLNGGAGNDEYYFARHDGQDAINDTGGIINAVRFDASVSASEFVLSRSENDLMLTLTATNDKLTIKDYLNGNLSTYTVSGSNVVNYSNIALIESFVFADGSSLPSVASIQESLLNIRGTVSDDALNGTAWSNVMYGADGNDVIRGFEDEDVLYGGAGNDTLDGGSGDTNLLYGQDGDDVLIGEGGAGFGHGYLHGGAGNDTYVFKSKASFSVYDEAGADDQIMLDGNVGLSDLSFQKWTDELSISVIGGGTISIPNHFRSDIYQVERLMLADGTALGLRDVQFGTGNALTGTAEDSILIGSSANDTLNGGDGNDWLNGGLGSDAMTGGFGNDRYFVDSAKDTVTELSDQGIDTVYSSVTYTLESGVERLLLTGSTKINGTGNALDNNLTGGSGANTLAGDAGNDWLDGKGGVDKMSGGEGDDTFVVDNSAETVTERASEGIDLVLSSATFSLPNNVENLTLTGMLAIDATGNKLDNNFIGNAAANLLTGNAGNDTLDGMAGSDTLVGGKGGDIYRLGRDYGTEIAIENDSTGGVIDIAQFLPGIGADQLWFRHVGNNLEVSIIGTADKLIVKDWYLGSAYRVEQFKTAEGLTLQDSNVENLVAAMAGFAPPDFGQTTLPPAYEVGLDSVITAFWL